MNPADILREAATALREDCAWDPEDFLWAVADWLELDARMYDGDEWSGHEPSLRAARAYIGPSLTTAAAREGEGR